MMTGPELEQALDRWGGDLDAWPAAEAARARALVAADPEAARRLTAARRVDGYLSALHEHAPPVHLAGRIVARVADAGAPSDAADRLLGWLGARPWRPAVIALLLAGAGFLAGATVGSPGVDPELAEDVTTLAFNDLYAEIENAQP